MRVLTIILFISCFSAASCITTSDFQGTYFVSSIGVNDFDNKIYVTFGENMIFVQGCRITFATFGVLDTGRFRTSDFVSNQTSCSDQNQNQVIQAFYSAARIQQIGIIILLRTEDGSESLRLHRVTPSLTTFSRADETTKIDDDKPSPKPFRPSLNLEGIYEFKIEDRSKQIRYKVFAILTTTQLIIKGCNTHIFSYQVLSDGQVSITEKSSSNHFCAIDDDQAILSIVAQTLTVKEEEGEDKVFLYRNGKLLARLSFTNVFPSVSKLRNFFNTNKNYVLYSFFNPSTANMTLKFTLNSLIIGGCNVYNYSYYADKSGVIEISEEETIGKNECSFNKDEEFLSSLHKVNIFEETENGFILKLDQAKFYRIVETDSTERPIGNSRIEGNFNLHLRGIEVEAKRKQFLLNYHRQYRFNYWELSGNQIEFQRVGSEKPEPEEQIVIDLLLNTVKYDVQESIQTIFFYDSQYKSTFTLKAIFNEQPTVGNLIGKFSLQLPQILQKMRVTEQKTHGQAILSGCNQSKLTFNDGFGSAGKISWISNISENKEKCKDRFNAVFAGNLAKSSYFKREQNQIQFFFDSTERKLLALAKKIQ